MDGMVNCEAKLQAEFGQLSIFTAHSIAVMLAKVMHHPFLDWLATAHRRSYLKITRHRFCKLLGQSGIDSLPYSPQDEAIWSRRQ
jgi:hypothetical protein